MASACKASSLLRHARCAAWPVTIVDVEYPHANVTSSSDNFPGGCSAGNRSPGRRRFERCVERFNSPYPLVGAEPSVEHVPCGGRTSCRLVGRSQCLPDRRNTRRKATTGVPTAIAPSSTIGRASVRALITRRSNALSNDAASPDMTVITQHFEQPYKEEAISPCAEGRP